MAVETNIHINGFYYLEITLCSSVIQHYENLGYAIPRQPDKRGRTSVPYGTKILVKVEDLMSNSGQKVIKICDYCGKKIFDQKYTDIINKRSHLDNYKDICKECSPVKSNMAKNENIQIENSILLKNPKLEKEIHPTLNGKISSDKIYSSSGLSVWWLCSKCGNSYKMSPNVRLRCNCPYCSGKFVNDTNCIWTTDSEFAKLLWNGEDGYLFSIKSTEKVDFKCPRCGIKIKGKKISEIFRNSLKCMMCSDGISYPEKFMANVLRQIQVKFEYQKVFEWSMAQDKNKNLKIGKSYDFYIPEIHCIIETHGR